VTCGMIVSGVFWAVLLVGTGRSQAPPALTHVRTPQQFAAAVAAGKAHIRVLQHMDLRALKGEVLCPDGTCAGNVVFSIRASTQSVVVRLHTSSSPPYFLHFGMRSRRSACSCMYGTLGACAPVLRATSHDSSACRAHRQQELPQSYPQTRGLQGACQSPVPAALSGAVSGPALPRPQAGQCVLLTTNRAFELDSSSRGAYTWVDNLLIRLARGNAQGNQPVPTLVGTATQTVWLTSVTFQGDHASGQERFSRGLDTDASSRVYCGGVQLVHLRIVLRGAAWQRQ
jgi:hypothetical protein